jgi:peptidoglycan/xylan/chitin deacetylase (PgdA/CDA1 family)
MMRYFSLMLIAALFVPCSNAQNIEARGEANRVVALTFDDLPEVFSRDIATMRRNTAELLRVLKLHRAPAVGFVNEGKLHMPARWTPAPKFSSNGLIRG